MKPAVFFDRDGVLNRERLVDGRPRAPLQLEDFHVVETAAAAVRAVCEAGYLAVVVTNQPELASGELAPDVLEAMHARLLAEVELTAIYVCPHVSTAGCGCHKPRPGLLERARDDWRIDLGASFLIGDRWRDIGAGNAAGCTTVLLERPYSGECQPRHVARDLPAAVAWILRGCR